MSSSRKTFEGIDGCGKTTQLNKVYDLLTSRGHKVARLREPGSTPTAEKIRKILLNKNSSISDITELRLYEAARCDLVNVEIVPLLKSGHIVLCDRFYDSTTAYQGYGRNLDVRIVERLHRIAIGPVRPDLTFIFDLPPEVALSRCSADPDRLESQSQAFFKRVRRGFREIARREPRRVKLIDARPSVDVVFRAIESHLTQKLKMR